LDFHFGVLEGDHRLDRDGDGRRARGNAIGAPGHLDRVAAGNGEADPGGVDFGALPLTVAPAAHQEFRWGDVGAIRVGEVGVGDREDRWRDDVDLDRRRDRGQVIEPFTSAV
jgi:hypothetical protein